MVTSRGYVPERGDLVWVSLDPTKGHEQRGNRPALVISSRIYNKVAGLALACPVTSQIKKYPFELPVTIDQQPSVILVDQIRSIDWKERKVKKMARASESIVVEAQELLKKLIT